jgi:hypothetical protein
MGSGEAGSGIMSQIKITPEMLNDLRQKAEAASPGPWKWKNENGSFSVEGPIRKNRYYDSNYIAAANPAVVLALKQLAKQKGEVSNADQA